MPARDAHLSPGVPVQAIPSLEGLVVIDVVEGTALASLPHMSAILSNRPPSFPSLQVAFEWARHSGKCTMSGAKFPMLHGVLCGMSLWDMLMCSVRDVRSVLCEVMLHVYVR